MKDRFIGYCAIGSMLAIALFLLVGCGDPASCWDGRPISCEQARKNEINREIDKRTAQADCKSGAGCCRPRVQDTEDPKIECTDDDWRDDNQKRLQR